MHMYVYIMFTHQQQELLFLKHTETPWFSLSFTPEKSFIPLTFRIFAVLGC